MEMPVPKKLPPMELVRSEAVGQIFKACACEDVERMKTEGLRGDLIRGK